MRIMVPFDERYGENVSRFRMHLKVVSLRREWRIGKPAPDAKFVYVKCQLVGLRTLRVYQRESK